MATHGPITPIRTTEYFLTIEPGDHVKVFFDGGPCDMIYLGKRIPLESRGEHYLRFSRKIKVHKNKFDLEGKTITTIIEFLNTAPFVVDSEQRLVKIDHRYATEAIRFRYFGLKRQSSNP